MTENILIEITSDTKGVTIAHEAVQGLKDVDKELKDQFDKTNKSIKDRAALVDVLSGGLGELTGKLKNAEKGAVAAFGTKGLADFKRALNDDTRVVELLFNAIGAAGEKLKTLDAGTPEFESLNKQIEEATALFADLTKTTDDTGGKTQSFRGRLRELREEMALLEEAGMEETAQFERLAVEAGQVEDQIGDTSARIRAMASDTFATDAVVEGIQGVAAAFQIGQGAAALFGSEDKELQQTLVKLNAIMAITQGIQQIQNLLERQTAVMIAVTNAQRSIATLRTRLQTAATEGGTIATALATAAQWALNAAMSANPAGLLLVAIGAAAGALLYFTSNTDDAAEAQKRFNAEVENELDYLKEADELLSKPRKQLIDDLKGELAAMQARGASQDAILKKEIAIAQQQRDAAAASKGLYQGEVTNIGEVSAQIELLSGKMRKMKNDLENDGGNFISRFITGGKSPADQQTDIDNLSKQIDTLRKQRDIGTQKEKESDDAALALKTKNLEKEKADRERAIKSAIAGAEDLVARQVAGTRAALNAELNAIEVRKAADLTNVNLTENERQKIRDEARQKEAAAQFNFEQGQMDIAAKAIEARANLQDEGSQSRLSLELKALDVQKSKELDEFTIINGHAVRVKQLTEQQKAEIDDRYLKIRRDKTKAFDLKTAQDEINARLADVNAQASQLQIDGAEATSEELLIIKQKQVHESAELERLSIENSTPANSELRRKLLAASYAKELADKKDLEKQKRAAETNQDEALFNANARLQLDRAKRLLSLQSSSNAERKKATADVFKYENDLIKNAHDADVERLKNGDLTKKDFDAKELDRLNQKEALKTAVVLTAEQERQEKIAKGMEIAETLANGFFDSMKAGYEADLQNVQDLENRKLITQQEADRRVRAIHRQQAILEREEAIFSIGLSLAKAIMNDAVKSKVLIPFDVALAATQIGLVMAKPLPKFAAGKVNIAGPGTGTSDSIPAMISKGESVITAAATRKYAPALEAMNALKFEIPTTLPLPKWADRQVTPQAAAAIDYEKMADAIAGKVGNLKDIPGMDVRIDKDGIFVIAKQGLDRTEYINRRYSFKK